MASSAIKKRHIQRTKSSKNLPYACHTSCSCVGAVSWSASCEE